MAWTPPAPTANDAEAICEAVGRPNVHLVAIKSEDQL
jgi:hypothetical protein